MATPMKAPAPLRDALFDHLGTVIVDDWPDRAECTLCAESVTDECDDHLRQRFRVEVLERLQRRIGQARDDSEFADVLAELGEAA